ncbi:MAG: TonB-dependent receptor [Muribaculaceae bacterium]|nr:TonB-dependent receptor [Muribaculaceae bacterium]
MKKHFALLGALFLACGSGSYVMAESAPQVMSASQAGTYVTGQVTDEKGEPIIGASVTEIGTTRGTVTDVDGKFSLRASGKGKIQVSFIGYKTITLNPGSNLNISLAEDNALLDEVVVVGYGQQKKVNLTGAVSVVDMDKAVGSRPEADLAKALQGAVPGLTVINNSGNLADSPTLKIRGVGTLSNSSVSDPLIVVDGVAVEDLSMINSADIKSISVLKDAASTSIYGTRAAFGVILITTKKAEKGERVSVRYNNNFAWDQATVLPDFPDVPTQLQAAIAAKLRANGQRAELFGMNFDELLPYAIAWRDQNGGKKKGYSEMREFQSWDDVGDYALINGKPMYYADFDVKDIWYRNAAPSQNHNVSLQGSSGRTTYYTSFGYNSKEDLMPWNPAKRRRYNAALNLQTDITDWLTAGARVNFTRRQMTDADVWSSIYPTVWRWASFFVPSGTVNGDDFRMVAFQRQAGERKRITDQLRLNAYLKANVTKDITLNADFTYDIRNYNFSSLENHSVVGYNWSGAFAPTTIVNQNTTKPQRQNYKQNQWTVNVYANWAKTINEAHNFNVMLGGSGEVISGDNFYAQTRSLYSEDYPEMNLTYGTPDQYVITSYTTDRSTAGYFGRFNYDYKGIYLLELNGRYDGSSSFAAGKHWAFFPSMSLGYRFSEEKYFEAAKKYVSNGKVRFSYGSIGNQAIGADMFLPTITVVQNNTATGYRYWLNSAGTLVNEFDMPKWVSSSLTWERINTLDVGLDLGFLNDQIVLGFDWYQRTTNDMLAPGTALPGSVGASAPYTNNGSIRTRGWELSINWRKQFNKDLGLYANFSIGDSKTKVTKWNSAAQLIGHPYGVTGYNDAYSHIYEGMTWGDIWGFETDRYFTVDDFVLDDKGQVVSYKEGVADQTGIQTGDGFVFGPGDIKYKDLNNDGKIDGGDGTLGNHGDLKVIGNTLPRYEYSFHVGGNWKGFDLDLFFQGVGKRDMWSVSSFVAPAMRDADVAIYANQTSYNIYDPTGALLQHPTNPGQPYVNISEKNDFPALYSGSNSAGNVVGLSAEGGSHNYYPQTKYLVNMSYLRVKNITLGYTLPTALTQKAYIQKLRLYASVDNLGFIHKGNGKLPLDPEMNGGSEITWGRTWPITRSWSFGLQLTF